MSELEAFPDSEDPEEWDASHEGLQPLMMPELSLLQADNWLLPTDADGNPMLMHSQGSLWMAVQVADNHVAPAVPAAAAVGGHKSGKALRIDPSSPVVPPAAGASGGVGMGGGPPSPAPHMLRVGSIVPSPRGDAGSPPTAGGTAQLPRLRLGTMTLPTIPTTNSARDRASSSEAGNTTARATERNGSFVEGFGIRKVRADSLR